MNSLRWSASIVELRHHSQCNDVLEVAITEQTGKPWQIMPLGEAAVRPECKALLDAIAVNLRDKYELSDD